MRLTLLEKNVLKTWAVSLSELIFSPLSITALFTLNGVLPERSGSTVL